MPVLRKYYRLPRENFGWLWASAFQMQDLQGYSLFQIFPGISFRNFSF